MPWTERGVVDGQIAKSALAGRRASVDGRLPYMDAARSMLMLLGVLLHAAQLYAPSTYWLMKDGAASPIFDHIIDFIHFFRMPAFFLISGFFCAMTLERRGGARFLSMRLPRLVIPIVTVALLFNIPQAWWLHDQGRLTVDLLDPGVWLSGRPWVFHLWFLLNLVVYFLLSALLGGRLLALVRHGVEVLTRLGAGDTGLMLALAALAVAVRALIVPASLADVLHEPLLFLGSPYSLIMHAGTFTIGFVIMGDERLRQAFFARGWISGGCGAILGLAAGITGGTVGELFVEFEDALYALAVAWFVLMLFRRLASREHPVWRYASDASYSVYLLHHGVVIAAGAYLSGFGLSVGSKYFLVTAIALLFPLAVHHWVVLRSDLASLLLNGKRRDRNRISGSTIRLGPLSTQN